MTDQVRKSRSRQLAQQLERAKGERVLKELGELESLVATAVRARSERPRAVEARRK